MDEANDVALVGLVESVKIGDANVPVELNTFDEMDSNDVDIIIKEINKITNKTVPNA